MPPGQSQDQYPYQQQYQYPNYQHSYPQRPQTNPHFAPPRPANDMSTMLMMMMGNNKNSGGSSGILQMMLGMRMINPLMFLALSAGDGLGTDTDMQNYLDKQVIRINNKFFSRDSNLTTPNVSPVVSQSVTIL